MILIIFLIGPSGYTMLKDPDYKAQTSSSEAASAIIFSWTAATETAGGKEGLAGNYDRILHWCTVDKLIKNKIRKSPIKEIRNFFWQYWRLNSGLSTC
jgi:hypothetical protein